MNSVTPLSVLILGFTGGRGKLYAECVSKRSDLTFEGVVKGSREIDLKDFITKPKIYENLPEALKDRKWDIVIVSVPHCLHHEITTLLIDAKVKIIIKEKPFAINLNQAMEYSSLVKRHEITFFTTTQRSILPSIQMGLDMLSQIGEIITFKYVYTFAMKEITSGWRSEKEKAIGGVLLDMGYHALDVLNLFFGSMTDGKGVLSSFHEKMREQNLEDQAEMQLIFGEYEGVLFLNRHAAEEKEVFKINGTKGSMEITRESVILYDQCDEPFFHYKSPLLTKAAQIQSLLDRALLPQFSGWRDLAFKRNIQTVAAIERLYKNSLFLP